jgi:hypothetical protein
MSTQRNYIDLKVFFGESIFARDTLDIVQSAFREFAPTWSKRLRLYESKAEGGNVDVETQGALYDAIGADHSVVTPFHAELRRRSGLTAAPRKCGFVELRGSNSAITVVLSFDELRFSRASGIRVWGNSLAFQIRKSRVDGEDFVSWGKELFVELCSRLRPWYGRANAIAEFESKNLDLTDGVRAIGVDVSKSLPGLYWLNFFGKYCAESIGRHKFEGVRAFEKRPIGDGVLLALDADPRKWDTREYCATDQGVRNALGPQYFFSRAAPNRPTTSPFAVNALEDGGSIQLVGD